MPRLAIVLTSSDLPEVELRAAALDGEVFAFRNGYCPIDEIESARHRAMTFATSLPPKVIAEQRTAAWVYGLRDQPPFPLEVCTDIDLRTKTSPRSGLVVREVVIDEHEVIRIGSLRLTTPLRTAIDLARFQRVFGVAECELVRGLSRLGGFGLDACVDTIDGRRNLPNKHRALERLAAALPGSGAQPALTR